MPTPSPALPDLSAFLARLQAAHIDLDASAPDSTAPGGNVTGRHPASPACVYPASTAQVQTLVRLAGELGVALYPVSTGLNWGYGSRSAPVAGCVLVDLGRHMNRILNADAISADNPVALIEPGVTQRQLFDFLQQHHPDLTFNVTGSAGATSLMGNALDRGVGYTGPRKEDLYGMEVVTGTGELLHTGFRRLGEDSPLAHSHPYGLGPMLDGLFSQANFGIVTSACFRLLPRRPKQIAVTFALHDPAQLPQFINELARLKREGVLSSVTHIGNRARSHASMGHGVTRYLENACGMSPEAARAEAGYVIDSVAPREWTSLAGVSGNPAQVRATLREIQQRTRGMARMRVLSDTLLNVGYAVTHRLRGLRFMRAQAAAISAMRPLHGLTVGEPGDGAIDNLLWRFDALGRPVTQLDQTHCGLLFVCPALPLDGHLVAEVVDSMKAVAAGFEHTLYMTLNIETGTSLVAVINLLFDRRSADETQRAHACASALLAHIRSLGLETFRARADMMGEVVQNTPAHWAQVRALKTTLDPHNIIAPGRYNLP